MPVSQDIKQRIINAAEQLHADNPTQLPKLADVRKLAQVNMSDASEVMKEWRANKLLPVQRIEEEAPAEIQAEARTLTSAIWTTAKVQAENKLREAEARYAEERLEAEQLRSELSAACDHLQQQLDEALLNLKQALNEKNISDLALLDIKKKLEQAESKVISLEQSEQIATAKNTELNKHILTLQSELKESKLLENQAVKAKEQADLIIENKNIEIEKLNKIGNEQKDQLHNIEKENMKLVEKYNAEKVVLEKQIASEKSNTDIANAKLEQAQLHINDLKELLNKASLNKPVEKTEKPKTARTRAKPKTEEDKK